MQSAAETYSVASAVSYAGASSILMSLWQVNDFSTSQIMKNYYTNLACGSSKEVSLRKAKLDYLENKDNQAVLHPAYWAAFVQTGDVKPLELVSKTGKLLNTLSFNIIYKNLGLKLILLCKYVKRPISATNTLMPHNQRVYSTSILGFDNYFIQPRFQIRNIDLLYLMLRVN